MTSQEHLGRAATTYGGGILKTQDRVGGGTDIYQQHSTARSAFNDVITVNDISRQTYGGGSSHAGRPTAYEQNVRTQILTTATNDLPLNAFTHSFQTCCAQHPIGLSTFECAPFYPPSNFHPLAAEKSYLHQNHQVPNSSLVGGTTAWGNKNRLIDASRQMSSCTTARYDFEPCFFQSVTSTVTNCPIASCHPVRAESTRSLPGVVTSLEEIMMTELRRLREKLKQVEQLAVARSRPPPDEEEVEHLETEELVRFSNSCCSSSASSEGECLSTDMLCVPSKESMI